MYVYFGLRTVYERNLRVETRKESVSRRGIFYSMYTCTRVFYSGWSVNDCGQSKYPYCRWGVPRVNTFRNDTRWVLLIVLVLDTGKTESLGRLGCTTVTRDMYHLNDSRLLIFSEEPSHNNNYDTKLNVGHTITWHIQKFNTLKSIGAK